MSTVTFPNNPTDGMVFEPVMGLFYKYQSRRKCWVRIDGSDLKLATPRSNGLMSKEDYQKIQNLLIPPIQTTLSTDDCSSIFKSGFVKLKSSDNSLEITSEPIVRNVVGNQSVSENEPWKLHENTGGFDFKLSLNDLIQKIEENGQLNRVQLQGPQGPDGLPGDPGVDRLDTGPVGPQGEDGANSPFNGVLSTEDIPFERVNQENRAIVDITTEQVSQDENYLVITRANIGDPDACPSLVLPNEFRSSLLVVLNSLEPKLIRNEQVTSGDCALICRICSSSLHHVNIEPILNEINNHFQNRVNRLKQSKEELVNIWLQSMVSLFNEQKAALCCALENCLSRNRNQRTRQYIESSRIQAAQGGFKAIVDGEDFHQSTDMDAFKNCPVPVTPSSNIVSLDDGVKFILDSKIHIGDPRTASGLQSLQAYLPAGTYTAQITSCCANFNQSISNNAYSGRTALLYKAATQIGSGDDQRTQIETKAITFPNFGTFSTNSQAQNAYENVTITFEHDGGNIAAWLMDPDGHVENNDGEVEVTIQLVSEEVTDITGTSVSVYIYRQSLQSENLVGRITPFSASISASDNLGLDAEENINLTVGPTLVEDLISTFFFEGTDGLSIFFVAGDNPNLDTNGDNLNTIDTTVQFQVEVVNNSVPVSVRAVKGNSEKISNGVFSIILDLNGDAAGLAIGEVDPNSDYSITVTPTDFGDLKTWNATGSGSQFLLAQGGAEGIGEGTNEVEEIESVKLFDIENVPTEFGGPDGLDVVNELTGQNVFITRPIDILIEQEPQEEELQPEDPGEDIYPENAVPPSLNNAGPSIIPLSEPPEPQNPSSASGCEIVSQSGSLTNRSTSDGTSTTSGTSVLPPEEEPPTEISSPGSSIQDVIVTINPSETVSLRYVFTDTEGVKFYSEFVPVTLSNDSLGSWINMSLGSPAEILSPPDEFANSIISSKTIDVSTIASQLTSNQQKKARSLDGISRLTYIQSLIGTPIQKLPDSNQMTDFEIQVQRMGSTSLSFGKIVALVGNPASEFVIDDFSISDVPVAQDESPVLGKLKRVVSTTSGRATRNNNGILYTSLTSYWADYTGFDNTSSVQRGVDFRGNNFFVLNESGNNKFTQVTDDRGFKDLLINLTNFIGTPIESFSGQVSGDAIAVSEFGVVYVADGQDGSVYAITGAAARIANSTHGDVHDSGANVVTGDPFASGVKVASDLPVTNQVSITLGKKKMVGGAITEEVIVNFGGTWFKLDGVIYFQSARGNAFRSDTDTDRCCFGEAQPGPARPVALLGVTPNVNQFGSSSAGNSITTDRNINPQPALPTASTRFNAGLVAQVQQQLDDQFNEFNLYALDDGKIYKVNRNNGQRTLFKDLGEPAFGLKAHPSTKDLYYIPQDRGTEIPSGTRIKRVDISDLNDEGSPKIKTVWVSEDGEGVFSIEFGNTLPADPTRSEFALYALLSTLSGSIDGQSIRTRLVEIAERPSQLPPEPEDPVPTNSVWTGTGDGELLATNANTIIFSRIPPGSGCQMFWKQVQWYERGWRIGACCGALVELDGTYWIIVKRSIGIDLSCGGGESENTPCIQQFIDSGDGHPAIAWPTTPPINDDPPGNGGEEFLGLPSSGFVNFVKDNDLSDQLLNLISSNQAIEIKGNPSSEIPFILFPST